jgi:UMF1 family MFS transporter
MKAFFETERGKRFAWYLYDFGNSGYAAVVILAIYSAYFKQAVVGGPEGSRLWGIAVAAAMLAVLAIAPVLGALADHLAIKKRLLIAFTLMSVGFTGLLFFVRPGDIVLGMGFFILAEIGFRSAQVFYDALLPEIAPRDQVGRVSGNGWALGSFGGILCLAICLPLVVLVGGNIVIRLTMVITAVWFIAFALPLFLYLPERARPKPLRPGERLVSAGFRRLGRTLSELGTHREYFKFMIAFILFNDGVMIALNFAAIIGAVLYGFNQQQLIVLILLTQSTNVLGSFVFGKLADTYSQRSTLFGALVLMALTVVWIQFNTEARMFYAIGSLAGFAMAGLQAISRSMVAKLSPPGRSGEFYGLFAVAGRSSSVLGPFVFGWVAAEAAIYYAGLGLDAVAAEQAGMRIAINVILVFLVAGGLVLATVREGEGAVVAETAV